MAEIAQAKTRGRLKRTKTVDKSTPVTGDLLAEIASGKKLKPTKLGAVAGSGDGPSHEYSAEQTNLMQQFAGLSGLLSDITKGKVKARGRAVSLSFRRQHDARARGRSPRARAGGSALLAEISQGKALKQSKKMVDRSAPVTSDIMTQIAAGKTLRENTVTVDKSAPVLSAEVESEVRDPTTWTIFQQNGPNHLGLWYNVLPGHQTALTTSGCVPRSRPNRSTRPKATSTATHTTATATTPTATARSLSASSSTLRSSTSRPGTRPLQASPSSGGSTPRRCSKPLTSSAACRRQRGIGSTGTSSL